MALRGFLRQKENKESQNPPQEGLVRYYFWEDAPYYGRRQGGKSDGYDTLEELEQDDLLSYRIQHNQEKGIPCWVMKSIFYERYV